jgi:L-alanine-DL-glutamate epimerase-like enolase superfamily enzyme
MDKIRSLKITTEAWRLKKPFIIARGARSETHTITVHVTENGATGRGEAVVSPRYGESQTSVIHDIEKMRLEIEGGITRADLQASLNAGSARNALDNALWDLEAKLSNQNVGEITGLGWPEAVSTVQTVSILPADQMREEAALLAAFPILKVKLDANDICGRVDAVHQGAPNSKLIIDANESWTIDILEQVTDTLRNLNVVMIEQPLPADKDQILSQYKGPLPIFADESCHTCADLPDLKDKYQGINIKLDKTGGLTEAIELLKLGKGMDFEVMVGCMLGTSLGMAPALFIANHAKYVDVDAPALLAEDHDHALAIKDGAVKRLNEHLWGG